MTEMTGFHFRAGISDAARDVLGSDRSAFGGCAALTDLSVLSFDFFGLGSDLPLGGFSSEAGRFFRGFGIGAALTTDSLVVLFFGRFSGEDGRSRLVFFL